MVLTGTLQEILKENKHHVRLTYLEALHLGFSEKEISGCENLSFGRDSEFSPLNMWGFYWRKTPWRNITEGDQFNQLTIQTGIWLHIIPFICFYWEFEHVIKNDRIKELIVASVHNQ